MPSKILFETVGQMQSCTSRQADEWRGCPVYYVLYFKNIFFTDMIAVPDFRAGAMENWGLITYRETALLWDEKTSSSANKQRVLTVIVHELAHQVKEMNVGSSTVI